MDPFLGRSHPVGDGTNTAFSTSTSDSISETEIHLVVLRLFTRGFYEVPAALVDPRRARPSLSGGAASSLLKWLRRCFADGVRGRR